MPSKNRIKTYREGGIYHVYNRGNRKEIIYRSRRDYTIFENLLTKYTAQLPIETYHKNYAKNIHLYAYCLMPNHFHFLLRQEHKKDMAKFMQSLASSFTTIINKKYNYVGHLFQGTYKARLITSFGDLKTTFEYIHNNPIEIGEDPPKYAYSSMRRYLNGNDKPYLTLLNQDGIDLLRA